VLPTRLILAAKATSGLTRRASLRMLQTAIKRFLTQNKNPAESPLPEVVAQDGVWNFWAAVAVPFCRYREQSGRPFSAKAVGVYALMGAVSRDLIGESRKR